MTREELNKLAERVEGLTGPCFGTECEIERLVSPHWTGEGAPKAYTASLDAALSLVPEGWNWGVWMRHDWAKQNAQVWHWERKASTKHGDAATPALALTVASLRARAEALP